jgi:hypothetical protein
MQNILQHCYTEDDSDSYQTLRGTPVVGINHMIPTRSVMLRSRRRSWFPQFRTKLGQCTSLDEIEALLDDNVRRWRGLSDLSVRHGRKDDEDVSDGDAGLHARGLNLSGLLAENELSDG